MKLRKMTVFQAQKIVHQEECDKLLDQDKVVEDAITAVEQNGIVFIDELHLLVGAGAGMGGMGKCFDYISTSALVCCNQISQAYALASYVRTSIL